MKAVFFDLDRALVRPASLWLRLGRWVGTKSLRIPPHSSPQFPELLLRRQAKALLAAHHWRGHVVVLLTSGSAEWGQRAADKLDADGVLCVPPGADPGLWRGSAVRQFCHRYGFVTAASFGYGSQAADWLWLETLGHPSVVAPTGQLRRRARVCHWPVVNLDRRSDVRPHTATGTGAAPPCVSLT